MLKFTADERAQVTRGEINDDFEEPTRKPLGPRGLGSLQYEEAFFRLEDFSTTMTFAAFDFKQEVHPGEPFYERIRSRPLTGTQSGPLISWHYLKDEGVLSFDLLVERMPAVFYTLVVCLPNGAQKTFSTGSGHQAGALLEALCLALERGQAGFGGTLDLSEPCILQVPAQPDGREVHVHAGKDGPAVVLVEETWTELGHKSAQSFWIQDIDLAKTLALEVANGMLDVSPGTPKAHVRAAALH